MKVVVVQRESPPRCVGVGSKIEVLDPKLKTGEVDIVAWRVQYPAQLHESSATCRKGLPLRLDWNANNGYTMK